jgi:squalene-hopene/tetraprenyl-beta-curcumene cyclase
MKAGSRRSFLGQAIPSAGLLAFSLQSAHGEVDSSATAADLEMKAVNFLRPRQGDDGSWSGDRKEPGITGLVVTALLRSGRVTADDKAVTKALGYLERFVGPKGGLSEAPHSVYATSVAIMAFQVANKAGRYDRVIKGGQEFLKSTQWDETETKGRETDFYGGAGYGGQNSRPDLSNTSFMMEALHNTGMPADDPALQKALVFVSRCQNLKSEFNDQPWASKINDGGFIYTAANGGSSVAGKTDDGGLRSYASMTYSGLRSMIYAGLTADDPRVKAAQDFISKHYTLDENPGLGQRGLYYYYQTFAKTLALLGKPLFIDASGGEHDWRADLVAALAKRQAANGAWVNGTAGFMEGDANLVTGYGLLALAHLRHKA